MKPRTGPTAVARRDLRRLVLPVLQKAAGLVGGSLLACFLGLAGMSEAAASPPGSPSCTMLALEWAGDSTTLQAVFGASTYTLSDGAGYSESGDYWYYIPAGSTKPWLVTYARTPVSAAGNWNYVELTFTNESAGTYRSYYYYVAGGGGWYTSSGGFQQLPLPQITQQPQSQTAALGDTVTLRVTASGLEGLQYQWRKDSLALLGETNARLRLPDIQAADAGDYTVVVSGCDRSVESQAARVTVMPGPALAPDSLVGRTYAYSMSPGQGSGVIQFLDSQMCAVTPDDSDTVYGYYEYSRWSYDKGDLVLYLWSSGYAGGYTSGENWSYTWSSSWGHWDITMMWLTYSGADTGRLDQWYQPNSSGAWSHRVGEFHPGQPPLPDYAPTSLAGTTWLLRDDREGDYTGIYFGPNTFYEWHPDGRTYSGYYYYQKVAKNSAAIYLWNSSGGTSVALTYTGEGRGRYQSWDLDGSTDTGTFQRP